MEDPSALGAAFPHAGFSSVFTKMPSNFFYFFLSSSSSSAPFIIIIGRCAFLRLYVFLVRQHRCDHYSTDSETKRGTRQNTKAAHAAAETTWDTSRDEDNDEEPPRRPSYMPTGGLIGKMAGGVVPAGQRSTNSKGEQRNLIFFGNLRIFFSATFITRQPTPWTRVATLFKGTSGNNVVVGPNGADVQGWKERSFFWI